MNLESKIQHYIPKHLNNFCGNNKVILGIVVFMSGIKASQLIVLLQKQIDIHGDCEVYAGGGDYPQGVSSVVYDPKGNAYSKPNSFNIY
jgi:hypothetical protein